MENIPKRYNIKFISNGEQRTVSAASFKNGAPAEPINPLIKRLAFYGINGAGLKEYRLCLVSSNTEEVNKENEGVLTSQEQKSRKRRMIFPPVSKCTTESECSETEKKKNKGPISTTKSPPQKKKKVGSNIIESNELADSIIEINTQETVDFIPDSQDTQLMQTLLREMRERDKNLEKTSAAEPLGSDVPLQTPQVVSAEVHHEPEKSGRVGKTVTVNHPALNVNSDDLVEPFKRPPSLPTKTTIGNRGTSVKQSLKNSRASTPQKKTEQTALKAKSSKTPPTNQTTPARQTLIQQKINTTQRPTSVINTTQRPTTERRRDLESDQDEEESMEETAATDENLDWQMNTKKNKIQKCSKLTRRIQELAELPANVLMANIAASLERANQLKEVDLQLQEDIRDRLQKLTLREPAKSKPAENDDRVPGFGPDEPEEVHEKGWCGERGVLEELPDGRVYLGHGQTMEQHRYHRVAAVSRTPKQFLGNLAVALLGTDNLKKISVSGKPNKKGETRNTLPDYTRLVLLRAYQAHLYKLRTKDRSISEIKRVELEGEFVNVLSDKMCRLRSKGRKRGEFKNPDENFQEQSQVPDVLPHEAVETQINIPLDQVEAILGQRIVHGKLQYRVRCQGHGSEDDTWCSEENLHCPDLLLEFQDAEKAKVQQQKKTAPKKRKGATKMADNADNTQSEDGNEDGGCVVEEGEGELAETDFDGLGMNKVLSAALDEDDENSSDTTHFSESSD